MDLELLFARADDIPRLDEDGAVELGIAGAQPDRRVGRRARRAGSPSASAAAGWRSRRPTPRRSRASAASPAVASPPRTRRTVEPRSPSAASRPRHRRSTARSSSRRRLDAADAIADLVSSGETLRENGLREIATVLESEAVLLAPPRPRPAPGARSPRTRDGARARVLAARPKRYLMLNAPRRRARDIARPAARASTRPPCCRWRATACTPCTRSSTRDEVVRLLGAAASSAGATGILVLPIEHLIP